jgi:HD domain-containing protein
VRADADGVWERAEAARTMSPVRAAGPGAFDGFGGFDTGERLPRPRTLADPLYGRVRVAAWAAALLATPPFRRLAGVSLSDVPGELLFDRPFPSRLDHAIGVYHLARLSRPRDRALQAAALAHDLGHGPFSHLTEPLMRERLGADHEARSARLLDDVRAGLAPGTGRLLGWLDWAEVGQLVMGGGDDGRGALLNGRLDYDNCDNVARFLLASGLGTPGYDPPALARALRPLPRGASVGAMRRNGQPAQAARPALMMAGARGDGDTAACAVGARRGVRVYIVEQAEPEARGWQADRATVYRFLHEGHRNLAAHAMLRKAVDLAAATHVLPAGFFDLTDRAALRALERALDRGLVELVRRVRVGDGWLHRCVWEAEIAPGARAIPETVARWRERLALEAALAGEAGLAPRDVIVEVLVSGAARALPPFAPERRPEALVWPPEPEPSPQVLHLFLPADAGRDYARRLRQAAERMLAPLGAVARCGSTERDEQRREED